MGHGSLKRDIVMADRKRWIVGVLVLVVAFIMMGCAAQVQAPPELTSAVRSGDFDTFKSILEENPKLVNARTIRVSSHPPLLHHVVYFSPDIELRKKFVEYLIANGVNVNAKDNDGRTLLHVGVCIKDVVEILIENGANINAKDNEGHTPLYHLLVRPYGPKITNPEATTEMLKFLISKGAHVSVKDSSKLFYRPIMHGCTEIVAILLARGIKAEDGDINRAASGGHSEIVKLLVASGVNVNARDGYGHWTALHHAAKHGRTDLAEFLIAAGADVNAKSSIWAYLSPTTTAPRGCTPLYLAAWMGHKGMVELLIAKGANVNMEEYKVDTPLHKAVGRGHKDIAELLIANGADVNAKNKASWLNKEGTKKVNGETPLHLAARGDYKDIAGILIAHGANVNSKAASGRTPLQIAVQKGHNIVADLLRKHGAVE
jgi:ankyrin repeat protein